MQVSQYAYLVIYSVCNAMVLIATNAFLVIPLFTSYLTAPLVNAISPTTNTTLHVFLAELAANSAIS